MCVVRKFNVTSVFKSDVDKIPQARGHPCAIGGVPACREHLFCDEKRVPTRDSRRNSLT